MKKCKKCFELKKDSEFPTLLECHKKVGQKIIHQCKQCVSDKSKKWYSKNKDRHKARTQKWNKNNEQERKNIRNKSNKKNRNLKRVLVINHYSNGTNKCCCCGENNFIFLTIDHINGGGNKERKETGFGTAFYWWLVKNNYPQGYQVLCYNCNCGRAKNGGICPHKQVIS